jgi:hypothetical protein
MSVEIFGESFTQDFGCSTFMPNEVLDSICNTAHFNFITSVEDLSKETRWHLAKEHGQKVVEMISKMHPATDSQLLVQTVVPVASTSGPKAREMICTSCGQPGHSSEFFHRIFKDELNQMTRTCTTLPK